MQGWATAIDPQQQTIAVEVEQLEEGVELSYDYLVFALGSQVDRQAVAGVDAHAYTLDAHGAWATDALKKKLAIYRDSPCRIAVVGGGATGVEVAPQVKAMLPHAKVSLITGGTVGAFKGPRVQKHIQQSLAAQAVESHEENRVVAV